MLIFDAPAKLHRRKLQANKLEIIVPRKGRALKRKKQLGIEVDCRVL
jgi:hypothetical protein